MPQSAPSSPFLLALDWWVGVLTGRAGTAVTVLAVGWLGLCLLQGRVPLREGLRIMVGAFILFSAPVIAQGLMESIVTPPPAQPAPTGR